ncbi:MULTISPECIES: hypothetical protein [Nostocaceae]|uniref:hypothetical protein n=1 Tax=Nostocaceae TaxID=1162 RepID=UPI001781F342|nr:MULTISPECIES: hypothetical protein [Nostocaceae]
MQLLDWAFSNFRLYRRLRGGRWWQVEIPLFDGNQIAWVHRMPECECYILQIEEY